jgi:spectinomycin phosphotransferase
VARALLERYGLAAASIERVTGGQDAQARVYRVETRDPVARYLVKVRPASAARDVAAEVTRYLHDHGAGHVVAPLEPRSGTMRDAGFALTVSPFLAARTGADAGLSARQWRELGAFARRLHTTVLPPTVASLLERETYRPAEIDLARRVDADIAAGRVPEGAAREVAAIWLGRRDTILALADRAAELGRQLERRALAPVLCHADLHTWNVLVDEAGELWVVDWDEAVLAPKERDLMFVVGGISARLVTKQATEAFFEGYGETTVDALAVAYYRHAWAIQDIGSYAERALRGDEPCEAARIFASLFEPGEIVAIAADC